MLTLNRKEGQIISITHGDETLDVYVTLIQGNNVKLSFDGPQSFEILREEIIESDATTV